MRLHKAIFLRIITCGCLLFFSEPNFAQTPPCENPQSARIAVITTTKAPVPKTSDPNEIAYVKRLADAESNLANQIRKQFGSNVCYLSDLEARDPKNFPLLRGTIEIRIASDGSVSNPKLFALAAEIILVEGPYFENDIPAVTTAILIESDSDYELAAKRVFKAYGSFTSAIDQLNKH